MVITLHTLKAVVKSCSRELIEDENRVKSILTEGVAQMGFTIYGYMGHKFDPCGLTCVLLIGESHVALHTFPEEKLVFLEITSCKDFDSSIFLETLKERLEGESFKIVMNKKIEVK